MILITAISCTKYKSDNSQRGIVGKDVTGSGTKTFPYGTLILSSNSITETGVGHKANTIRIIPPKIIK